MEHQKAQSSAKAPKEGGGISYWKRLIVDSGWNRSSLNLQFPVVLPRGALFCVSEVSVARCFWFSAP